MSDIEVREVASTRKEIKKFVLFAEQVYKGLDHYVPPIYSDQVKMILKGPFEEIGQKQLFMAYRNGKPVARISAHINRAHNDYYKTNQGFFGWFEALEDQEAVNAIVSTAEKWLKSHGCSDMIGPMNFAIYDEIGMLVNCFDQDPVVLCTYNPPYYPVLLENAGFVKEIDWFAYLKDATVEKPIPDVMAKITKRIESRNNVTVRYASKKNWEHEVSTVRHIFEEAWAENWGNVPFTDNQWHHVTKELKLILKEELAFIVEVDGIPAGFSITIPDANVAVKKAQGRLFPFGLFKILFGMKKIKKTRTIIMGVLKEYRKRGFDMVMIQKTIENGLALGYESSDCSLIVETNERMIAGLEAISAERYKTYRIFKRVFK